MFSEDDLTAGQRAVLDQNVATARTAVDALTRLAHEIHHRTDDQMLAYSLSAAWLVEHGVIDPSDLPSDEEAVEGRDMDDVPESVHAHRRAVLMLVNATQQLADLQDAYLDLHDEHEALQGRLDNAISEVERLSTNQEFDDITALFDGADPPADPDVPGDDSGETTTQGAAE